MNSIIITDFKLHKDEDKIMAKRNFSSKRNAIYQVLCATDTHPGARWVYDQLKPHIPDLSLGTVYRNIALFKDEGTVRVICSVNGEERYDGCVEPHSHFVCNCCGRVIDVDDESMSSDFTSRLSEKGFTVESRYVLYYGICPECKKNKLH